MPRVLRAKFCKSRAAYLVPRLTSRASNTLSAAHKYPGALDGITAREVWPLFLVYSYVYSLLQTVSVRPQVLHHGELLKWSSVRDTFKEITRKNSKSSRERSPIQDKRESSGEELLKKISFWKRNVERIRDSYKTNKRGWKQILKRR